MGPSTVSSDTDDEVLNRQLEELSLLKHALLPGEQLTFVVPPSTSRAAALWTHALDEFTMDPEEAVRSLLLSVREVKGPAPRSSMEHPSYVAASLGDSAVADDFRSEYASGATGVWGPQGTRIRVGLDDSKEVWYEVDVPRTYPDRALDDWSGGIRVSVKGEAMGREEQARWQEIVKEKMEVAWADGCEYPIYQLLSEHLIPLLHDAASLNRGTQRSSSSESSHSSKPRPAQPCQRYHALLTSHHLVSPTKRRNLLNLSATLSLTGFAKVGHPGILYAEGERGDIEEWVTEVKSWQWLALRVRFVEQLPVGLIQAQEGLGKGSTARGIGRGAGEETERRRWVEMEKVGDVVDEMRRLGRESYVVEMGIGSVGAGVA